MCYFFSISFILKIMIIKRWPLDQTRGLKIILRWVQVQDQNICLTAVSDSDVKFQGTRPVYRGYMFEVKGLYSFLRCTKIRGNANYSLSCLNFLPSRLNLTKGTWFFCTSTCSLQAGSYYFFVFLIFSDDPFQTIYGHICNEW